MNKGTITLTITVSSDTIRPGVLQNALSVFGGEMTAQLYDHLWADLPELVKSEDFQTDWLMRIRMGHPAQPPRLAPPDHVKTW